MNAFIGVSNMELQDMYIGLSPGRHLITLRFYDERVKENLRCKVRKVSGFIHVLCLILVFLPSFFTEIYIFCTSRSRSGSTRFVI